jgi:predicted RNase H-like HicB family nuclease
MFKYQVVIFWDEEEQVFVAEVPELPGCYAHGDSPDDALANCEEAIDFWCEAAEELGRTIPEPKPQRLQFP